MRYPGLFIRLAIEYQYFCGAGGSRTRVQTRCKNAFYMLSRCLIVGFRQVQGKPTGNVSS